MRTIIAGSREGVEPYHLVSALQQIDWVPTAIISGTAKGADKLGEQWAIANNVPLEKYPAKWDKYGKSAGYKRNAQMAEAAEALVALWDGKSKGTSHMIDLAKKHGLKIFIKYLL